MFVASVPKGSKGDTSLKIIPYTDGLLHLPEAGGVLDQPHSTMVLFENFEAGESEAFSRRLKQ